MARTKGEVCSKQKGQALTEYAVLFAVILVILIGAVRMVGEKVNGSFSKVVDSFQHQSGGGGGGDH